VSAPRENFDITYIALIKNTTNKPNAATTIKHNALVQLESHESLKWHWFNPKCNRIDPISRKNHNHIKEFINLVNLIQIQSSLKLQIYRAELGIAVT